MSEVFIYFCSVVKTVVVAQLVRASDCDSEGRGFEPPRLPQTISRISFREIFFASFLPSITILHHVVCLTKHYCE